MDGLFWVVEKASYLLPGITRKNDAVAHVLYCNKYGGENVRSWHCVWLLGKPGGKYWRCYIHGHIMEHTGYYNAGVLRMTLEEAKAAAITMWRLSPMDESKHNDLF